MNQHLLQVKHNERFHQSIETQFADQFYDWKVTVLFYVAIHCLQTLAAQKGINIGNSHYEIENNINPDRHNAKMRITKGAWRQYKNLMEYSRTSRYEGVTDFETFEKIRKLDHSYCLIHLDNFKKYISSQGVTFLVE